MTKLIQRRSPASRPVYDAQPIGNGVFRVTCDTIGYEYDQCMTEAVVMELFQHKPIVIDAERLARKIRENPDEGCVEAGWLHSEGPFGKLRAESTDFEIIDAIKALNGMDIHINKKVVLRAMLMKQCNIDQKVYDSLAQAAA